MAPDRTKLAIALIVVIITGIVAISLYLLWQPAPEQFTVTVATTNGGTTSPPPGIYTYSEGATVRLTAMPDGGYVFDAWDVNGVEAVNPEISITVDQELAVTAAFTPELPPPPPLILAEATVEATVVDVNKTFSYHYDPPSPSQFPNITAYDAYDILLTLSVDALTEYTSAFEGLLGAGDVITVGYFWLSPHYVDGQVQEMPNPGIGDRVRAEVLFLSIYEDPDLSDPTSYWWELVPSDLDSLEILS